MELNAQRTPELTVFPAHRELPSLRRAFLHYPYHCCALSRSRYGFGFRFVSERELDDVVPCPNSTWTNATVTDARERHARSAGDMEVVEEEVATYTKDDYARVRNLTMWRQAHEIADKFNITVGDAIRYIKMCEWSLPPESRLRLLKG